MHNIRNFCIVAHIDHGKSTLADRMLEMTGTIEKRKMRAQVLDQMDLERERGITIKMAPVRIVYRPPKTVNFSSLIHNIKGQGLKIKDSNSEFILNLIDTPGHIDFTYEVSRALRAVEGVILLVDATQGVQAQTLSVLSMAREMNLAIIPALNKIDLAHARINEVTEEISKLLDCDTHSILKVSGKTGEGVDELLQAIIEKVPAPKESMMLKNGARGLIFDFQYSTHRGIIVYTRIFEGEIKRGDKINFVASRRECIALEVGIFKPEEVSKESLSRGEIGYIVTGIKEPGIARVGDTISKGNPLPPALSGYNVPMPVVWASLYPENQDDIRELRLSLERLQLSDSSISFEEESSGTLGRGFRVGFLGMLHLEIITERLKREFGQAVIITSPTISYEILEKNGARKNVYSAAHFPDDNTYEKISEPWVLISIITPPEFVGSVNQLLYEHEALLGNMENFSHDRVTLHAEMPLRELMRNFFDKLKSVSSGYASLSYKPIGLRVADITRLDVLVADERIPAFSRVISRRQVEKESEAAVEKLVKILPRQLFEVKIQAKAYGRIIASRRISAMRKDVTGYLYGGDVTRKMKLLEKQKKGKKRMKQSGRVNIPHDVFLKMTRQ